jgi:hypothetical protein
MTSASANVARLSLPSPERAGSPSGWINEILDHFRKRIHQMGGGSYQTLINDALHEHIRRGGIEAAVRRAVREELRGAGLKQTAG